MAAQYQECLKEAQKAVKKAEENLSTSVWTLKFNSDHQPAAQNFDAAGQYYAAAGGFKFQADPGDTGTIGKMFSKSELNDSKG
jgi:hypothetical protein